LDEQRGELASVKAELIKIRESSGNEIQVLRKQLADLRKELDNVKIAEQQATVALEAADATQSAREAEVKAIGLVN